MCDQKIGSSGPPFNLDRNEISILKILRSFQTETADCAGDESGTETGRGKSNACFQFCKHCIVQLDSVIAANPILTSSSSAFCEVIPNSNLTSIGQYNCNLSSSGSGPSPIPSQECSESNNKLLMFLKLVSAALSLNSLREVETTHNNSASHHTYDIDHNHCTVISSSSISAATSPVPGADQLVTQQFGEETIFGLNSTYCNNYDIDKNKTATNGKIEACYQLPFATSTSSQPEALLDHQYNAYEYDNTSTYTVEALVPEQRSYIFPNNIKHETSSATATACAPDPGLGNFQFLGADTTQGHGRELVLSYQPNSVLTLELPGLTNIIENVDGKNSNQSCYDAGLPYMGQEVEISLLGQASQPQYQLPPLSLDYLVPKRKSRKQKLASSIPQQPQPPKAQNDKSRSVKVKEGQRKREKQSKKSVTLPHAVSQILPENNPHCCKSCTSTFPSKYSLNKHRREQHKAFTCQFCYQSYFLAKELREHKLKCALKTKKIYSCQICLKEYLSRESVRRHERTHSGIKPHKCDKCGRCYYERYDLVKHQKRYANGVSCVGPVHGTNTGNFKFMASNDVVTVVDFYTTPTSTSTSSTMEIAVTPPSEATLVQSSSGNPISQNENIEAVKYFSTCT